MSVDAYAFTHRPLVGEAPKPPSATLAVIRAQARLAAWVFPLGYAAGVIGTAIVGLATPAPRPPDPRPEVLEKATVPTPPVIVPPVDRRVDPPSKGRGETDRPGPEVNWKNFDDKALRSTGADIEKGAKDTGAAAEKAIKDNKRPAFCPPDQIC